MNTFRSDRLALAMCIYFLGGWISGCSRTEISPSPSGIRTPTAVSTPRPGLVIHGNVRLESGPGLADVKIFRGLASYAGTVAAVTDAGGNYQSVFQFIPGDEMISVWAELPGYSFEPTGGSTEQGWYFWRHYFGLEDREIDFIARLSGG